MLAIKVMRYLHTVTIAITSKVTSSTIPVLLLVWFSFRVILSLYSPTITFVIQGQGFVIIWYILLYNYIVCIPQMSIILWSLYWLTLLGLMPSSFTLTTANCMILSFNIHLGRGGSELYPSNVRAWVKIRTLLLSCISEVCFFFFNVFRYQPLLEYIRGSFYIL